MYVVMYVVVYSVHRLNFNSIVTHTVAFPSQHPSLLAFISTGTVVQGYKPPVDVPPLFALPPSPQPAWSFQSETRGGTSPFVIPTLWIFIAYQAQLTTRHWRLARSFLSGYPSYNMLVEQGHVIRLSLVQHVTGARSLYPAIFVQHVSGARSFYPAISLTTC